MRQFTAILFFIRNFTRYLYTLQIKRCGCKNIFIRIENKKII